MNQVEKSLQMSQNGERHKNQGVTRLCVQLIQITTIKTNKNFAINDNGLLAKIFDI